MPTEYGRVTPIAMQGRSNPAIKRRIQRWLLYPEPQSAKAGRLNREPSEGTNPYRRSAFARECPALYQLTKNGLTLFHAEPRQWKVRVRDKKCTGVFSTAPVSEALEGQTVYQSFAFNPGIRKLHDAMH